MDIGMASGVQDNEASGLSSVLFSIPLLALFACLAHLACSYLLLWHEHIPLANVFHLVSVRWENV